MKVCCDTFSSWVSLLISNSSDAFDNNLIKALFYSQFNMIKPMKCSAFRNVRYSMSLGKLREKSIYTFHVMSSIMQSPRYNSLFSWDFLTIFCFLSYSYFVATSQLLAVLQVSLSPVTQDRINILLTQWHKDFAFK